MADPEDRFKLALMYSKDGDWAKAQEQYRTLLAQTENTSDLEVFNRRPDYIAQFIDELLKHYQGDQRQEVLIEAQDLIDETESSSPRRVQRRGVRGSALQGSKSDGQGNRANPGNRQASQPV